MDNKKIEKLTQVLQKLNQEGVTEALRKEALDIVSNISPVELSIAEQNLIEKGMKPQDLRHLCDIHMEVLKGELDKIKTKIEPGHVVYTLIAEHDKILEFLTLLEEVNSKIQKTETYINSLEEINELKTIVFNILDAENHHQREEKVLFTEMESREITGPTRIMRMEHEDIKAKKEFLKLTLEESSELNFNEFKEKVDESAKYIIFNMRDHIFKENYILYPTAIESIQGKEIWNDMKKRCDEIGYCGFTPKV
ncbi:DUF438 domain-containing protein [Clostridium estertheticum]|uniref:DUF438 domain-containing protein n=1 Tax=Clostridium estertheticum TaxID=238834 RepID=A0A7Y3ST95_9CLOT|nr:DUF438 domain-containing protein [Clostridium estertheticum]MBW9170065.1 DUF438 domain-containing protein [Clostridium estertheticum]MBX4263734.1 DUF438 domain-containing protein [Clostridium estertheticum]NNU74966.1 DUF438 domain-containing protein [Clostridium estertheticum]WBL47421.1 DUF438 domain-containing protein [Clostridium estertheticum]WLC75583.1 DUF438 domain-containing protein [Clostridium estertheticum]